MFLRSSTVPYAVLVFGVDTRSPWLWVGLLREDSSLLHESFFLSISARLVTMLRLENFSGSEYQLMLGSTHSRIFSILGFKVLYLARQDAGLAETLEISVFNRQHYCSVHEWVRGQIAYRVVQTERLWHKSLPAQSVKKPNWMPF